jgi:formylglycine-generating enzyme required for sulfatase activity/serine/threonine protein kinase
LLSPDHFFRSLVTSGLFTAAEVESFRRDLSEAARFADADAVATQLVEMGKLTPFQSRQLLSGVGTPLVLGDYVLLDKLGSGGMGQVFKAQHRHMKRLVAVKLMLPDQVKDEGSVRRFRREVEASARLEHPNIVAAFDSRLEGDVFYLVMQYVEGADLHSVVRERGAIEVERAVDYVLQAARGLSYAHSQGVVHRDVKPSNLLLDKHGVVKVLDVGLARLDGASSIEGLTGTSEIMGTVDFMSPEQSSDAHDVDVRSDIYSLGCTLWFLLTGRPTYDGDTLVKRLVKHREAPIPSLAQACDGVDWPLEQIHRKMTAKRADDRYASMNDVIAALERRRNESPRDGGTADDAQLREFFTSIRTRANSTARGPQPATARTAAPAEAVTPSAQFRTVALQDPQTPTDAVSTPGPSDGVESPPTNSPIPAGEAVSASASSPAADGTPQPEMSASAGHGRKKALIGGLVGAVAVVGLIVALANNRKPSPETNGQRAGSAAVATSTAPGAAAEKGPTAISSGVPAMSPYELLTSAAYEWSPAEPIAEVDPTELVSVRRPALTEDGLTLVCRGLAPGGGASDLYLAKRSTQDDLFRDFQPLSSVNSLEDDDFPTLSADGRILVFASNRSGSLGGYDLWQSMFGTVRGEYSKPVNLGSLNSPEDDSQPCLHSEGLALSFQSGEGYFRQGLRGAIVGSFSPAAPMKIDRDSQDEIIAGRAFSGDGRVVLFSRIAPDGRGPQLRQATRAVHGGDFEIDSKPIRLVTVGGKPLTRPAYPWLSHSGGTLVVEAESEDWEGVRIWMSRRIPKTSTNETPALPPADLVGSAAAQARQQAWAARLKTEVVVPNSLGMKMVLLPPGEFLMGSTDEQVAAAVAAARAAGDDAATINKIETLERPRLRVEFDRPIRISATEVTVGQFRQFFDEEKYVTAAERTDVGVAQTALNWRRPVYSVADDLPVTFVNWDDAQAFCRWLSVKEKARYRLPTDAEWEYACRAGTTTQYWFGDDEGRLAEFACFKRNAGAPHAVAAKGANPFGLYDMSGNVWEWCEDRFDAGGFHRGSAASSGGIRCTRGGTWRNGGIHCRSAFRNTSAQHVSGETIGFRVVAEIEPVGQPPGASGE